MSMSKKSFLCSLIPPKKRQFISLLAVVLGVAVSVHFIDDFLDRRDEGAKPLIRSGPWGDLQEWDIRLEQPLEYVGFDKTSTAGPFWTFGNLTLQTVRGLLLSSGCTEDQAASLLESRINGTGSIVVLNPDDKTLLSLSPETRSKLYLLLSQNPANRLQNSPYFIPDGNVEKALFRFSGAFDSVIPMVRKLVYKRNGYTYFSDPEIILRKLPSDQDRLDFLQALTGQNVVLVQLLIRPGSDIDKPLYYWAPTMPGVMFKDLVPLLKAMKRVPHGGAFSIIHLLPPMAREKLFTSLVPPKDRSVKELDCHWTALNFFYGNPDPRMSDNAFASRFIEENFYQIAAPCIPGDLVLLMNSSNEVLHSSVYMADDIVFTKNGVNYAQPWVFMRMKTMQGYFSALQPTSIVYFRRKGI